MICKYIYVAHNVNIFDLKAQIFERTFKLYNKIQLNCFKYTIFSNTFEKSGNKL